MAQPLINIHVIIAHIIACILCTILIFIVFSQTMYYLCISKWFHSIFAKDETNLKTYQSEEKTATGSKPASPKASSPKASSSTSYDDIHSFFKITTTVSMMFCLVSSTLSIISNTDLIITGTVSHHITSIRFICFVSWLFSHYSMSSVFVGRLYVSFKDSIFQYPLRVIRLLSISLASLPLLLIISFLFWIFKNNDISLIFFIGFMSFDILFSIVLTSLFIHKLYQLTKGRIMTRRSSGSTKDLTVKTDSFKTESDAQNIPKTPTVTITNIEITNIGPETPKTDVIKIELPFIADVAMPDFAKSDETNESLDPGDVAVDKQRVSGSDDAVPPYVIDIQRVSSVSKHRLDYTMDTPIVIDSDDELGVDTHKCTPRSTNSKTPVCIPTEAHTTKTVRFSSVINKHPPEVSKTKKYMVRARSLSNSISTISNPRRSVAFIKGKERLDQQQLQLIDSMTRHGLLLCLSSFTSLLCLIYIMFTFEHYQSIQEYDGNDSNINTVYYYLYWNMGIAAFLNGLSLYLSFAFAQWFYKRICNKVHKWLEALCVILIVKRLKRNDEANSINNTKI